MRGQTHRFTDRVLISANRCPSCASESAPKMVTIVVQYEEDKQEGIFTVAESLLYRRCPKIQNWPNTTFIIQPGR